MHPDVFWRLGHYGDAGSPFATVWVRQAYVAEEGLKILCYYVNVNAVLVITRLLAVTFV